MYINRGDCSIMYFKVDLDEEGWPILTAYDSTGNVLRTMEVKKFPSFADLEAAGVSATSEQGRMAGLRINIHGIFRKFDETFSYARERVLPPCDYKMVYDEDDVNLNHRVGLLSKQKVNQYKKGTPIGDMRCTFCDYRKKCLEDSGIRTRT